MIVRDAKLLQESPKAVLLDLDNTLYAYAPCHKAGLAEAQALARELLNLPEDAFARAYAQGRDQVKAQLGHVASAHSRLLYFQRAIEIAGLASQVGAALQLEQAYWRAFLDASQLYDSAIEFLDDLRIARIPVVIVTDLTAQIQFRKMLYWRLDRHIDWIVTSEESGADKPAPASFKLALEKVSVSEPPIWMIGDEKKDIEGARDAVGAIGFLKCEPGETASAAAIAEIAFSSFADLRRCLAKAAA